MLLGRSATRPFQMYTGPGRVFLPNGPVLLDLNRDKVRAAVTTPESPEVDRVLAWLVEHGWERLIRASGEYEFRLRPLRHCELKDTPEQTHVFEVRIPRPRTHNSDLPATTLTAMVHKVESAARGHLSRQSTTNQATATDLIKEYVDLRFWRPSTADQCRATSAHQPTPVFLIGGEGDPSGRKPRLVCNFRPANKELPPAGNSDRIPSHLLSAMRLTAPRVVLVTDASRAFYKLRLADPDGAGADQLWLVAAIRGENGKLEVRHFLCDRLAFGLAVGPSALVSTMTALMGYPRLMQCFAGWYIDDLIIAALNALHAHNDFSLLDSLLRRVGHSLQRAKTWLIAHSSVRSEVLELFGRDMSIQNSAKIFGAKISFQSDSLSVACDNSDKVAALQTLSALSPGSCTLSKKEFFRIGGQLGYDLSRQHAEVRVLADCLRSLTGRAKTSWSAPVDLTSIDDRAVDAMAVIRDWATTLLALPADCQHATPLFEPSCPLPIEVYTDASMVGGAFIISRGSASVWEEAFRWTKTKVRWHSNRLECHTLLAAMKCVADILQCYGSCAPGESERLSVIIHCDNRSSVSWARDGNLDVGGKQQRRAMHNLIDAMADEVKVIRRYAALSVVHLPGANNVDADRLSRLCSQIQPLLEGGGPAVRTLLEVIQGEKEEVETLEPADDGAEALDFDLEDSELDPLRDSVRRCAFAEVNPDLEDDPISRLSLPIDPLAAAPGVILDTVLATDALIRHDRILDRVSAVSSSGGAERSWAERTAADCYDVASVCRVAAVMRFVLRVWRASRSRSSPQDSAAGPYPTLFTDDDRLAVARSLQCGLDSAQSRFLHFDSQTDLWYSRDPLPTGQFKFTPFVPAAAAAFQNKVIGDAHRRCAHRGPDYTMAEIQDWALERPAKRTAALVTSCLHCQVKRAKRGVHAELEMSTDRTVLGPFEYLALDHFGLGNKRTVLSAICRVTGFVILAHCASHSASDTWAALRLILHRIPRRPRCFLTDKATHIFEKVVERYQQHYGVAVEYRHTPAAAPHENGQLERVHASVLSVLKTSLQLEKLGIADIPAASDFEVQGLLDSVSYTLNQRPMHELHLDVTTSNRLAVTPALLVYGPGVLNGVYDDGEPVLPETSPALRGAYVNWRKFYDGYYWKKLKAASARAIANQLKKPLHAFAVGEHALVFAPNNNKLRMPFRVCKIVDIRGNQLVVQTGAKTTTVAIHNACKLTLRYDSPRAPFDVTRVGARVSVGIENVEYLGEVREEAADGSLLVQWDANGPVSWPDEWLAPGHDFQLVA